MRNRMNYLSINKINADSPVYKLITTYIIKPFTILLSNKTFLSISYNLFREESIESFAFEEIADLFNNYAC